VGNRKAVFLFPYKALVNEKFDQFSRTYGDRLAMRVIRCSGDYQDHTAAFFKGKYDIAVLTYETFLSLALSNQSLLNQIGLVVLDEAQFITDPRRGIVVEMLFTYLLAARERGVSPQLVALSAVIGDVNDFDAWLGIAKLVTKERPIPLVEGVLDRSGCFQFVDASGNGKTCQLLPERAIVQRRNKASSQDVIVPLVKQLLAKPEERVVVFRNNRGSAQGCANYLAEGLGLPPAVRALSALPDHDRSSSSDGLQTCLSGGTAFHTSDLSREEREVVEREFRLRDGGVRVIVATTTIAAGVNTPASTVILAEQEFLGDDGRPFTVAEYKNMAGRAGRLGFQEEGRSIILADTSMERALLFHRYVQGAPESLRSSFDSKQMETWLIRLLAQAGRIDKQEVPRLLANTYGGFLNIRSNPSWRATMEQVVSQIIGQMLELEILEEEDGRVRLTLLGQACGRSSLSFPSAMKLVGLLKSWQGSASAESLMVLVQGLPELDEVYTPVMKRGQAESRWPAETSRRYGVVLARVLQRGAADDWIYYARCKRAMILHHFISGRPMSEIEQDATTNAYQGKIGAGSIRSIADATRFHLGSAWKIATLLLVNESALEEKIDILLKQIELGLPEAAIGLTELPMSLLRGEYLALYNAGLHSAEAVWGASPDLLRSLLSSLCFEELQRLRAK
jgi:helicase